jgi:hypothetical protein
MLYSISERVAKRLTECCQEQFQNITLGGGNVVGNSNVRIFAFLKLLMVRKFTMVEWEARRLIKIQNLLR